MANIKRISLDWDNITREEAERRIKYISSYTCIESIRLMLSPCDGYHCYVILSFAVPDHIALRYRRDWKDDGNRIITDLLYRPHFQSILFQKKHLKSGDWLEVPL